MPVIQDFRIQDNFFLWEAYQGINNGHTIEQFRIVDNYYLYIEILTFSPSAELWIPGTGLQSARQKNTLFPNLAGGSYSIAHGSASQANGPNSYAGGNGSIASDESAHAEGIGNTSTGIASHSEGELNVSSGEASHTEGLANTASLTFAHAEGNKTLLQDQRAMQKVQEY